MSNIKDLKTVKTSDDVVNYLNSLSEGAIKTTTSVTGLAKNLGTTSKTAIEFTQGIKDGSVTLEKGQTYLQGYQSYLKSTSSSLSLADVKTKALSASMKVLSTVGWMAIFTIGSVIIGKVVGSIDDYIHRVERAKEAASEAADRIDTLSSSLKSNQKTVSDSAKRFAELAQGIDALTGKNVSLSDSDYEEFLTISNDLAEIFPTLSRNYDENGNAIVNLSGNVDTIVGSLQDLIEAQRNLANSQIADELPTVFKGAATKSDAYKAELDNLEQQRDALINSLGNVQSNDFADNFIDGISKRWLTVSSDNLEVLSQMKSDYEKLLKEANIAFETLTPNYKTNEYGQEVPVDFTFNITSSDEDIEKAKNTIDEGVQSLAKQYEKDIAELNTDIANTTSKNKSNWSSLSGSIAAWLSSDSSYKIMSDSMQSSVQQIVNNLDWSSLDFSSWDDAEQYVQDNIIGLFEGVDGSQISKQFGKVFDLKTQFQNGEVTLDEYLKGVSDFKALIDGFDDNTKKSIDFIFNVSSSDGSSVDSMLQGVENKLQESAKDEIGQLSLGDLEIASKLKIPEGTLLSWEELQNLIKEYKESVKAAPDFTTMFSNLPTDKIEEYVSLVKSGNVDEGTISSYSELNDLMSQTGMSAEDATKALKNYADGFTLSTDLTSNIQEAYDLLKDVGEQYEETGKIGLSSLESIANTYPQLRSAVNEYTQGLISADDMMSQLQTAYDNDTDAYKTAMAYKLSGNEEFFSTIFNNNQSLFTDLANAYGLDVENWKTMAQAKAEIDQKLIQSLSAAWSKYYNIVFDSASGMASVEGVVGSKPEGADGEMSKAQRNALDAAFAATDRYNDVANKLNEAANIQIDPPDFGGKGSMSNKSGGSDKNKKEDTQKEIDWIARGTKVLQDEYAKLEDLANRDTVAYLGLTQEEFDKAKSIFDNGLGNSTEGLSQLQSYADKAGLSLGELYTMIQSGAPSASKENALQSMLKMQTETLLPQYQREVEAYSKSYADALKDIPSEYKDKIEKGGVDIESLPSDLADKVQTAIDANEKLKSSEKQLEEGREKQIQTIKELHENRTNAIDIENEKLEQSNKIIKSQMELMEARGEIVDANFYERQKNNNKGLISGNEQDIAEWESEMADLRAANVSVKSKDYKELQAKVKAAKNEMQGLKLEQEEINQALEQMPIDNLNTVTSMYKDISSAIEQWGDVASATGEKLNADYYQALISNGATTIDQYKELAGEIENVMDDQEEGSTRWNELYGQLQSVNSEMSSMVTNLRQWNEELLKMPLENIESYSSELQKVADGLNDVKSEYDSVASAVTDAIQTQIDLINEQKDAVNEQKTAEIDALQEKLDLLDEQNEKRKLQYDLEQKQYELERARNQKTNKVIRNGEVDYEKDSDAERSAQEALKDSEFNLEKYNIQSQIDSIQDALDGLNEKYQDQIDSLQKISDKWSEISSKIEQAQNEAKADEILGTGWKDKVLSGNDTVLFNTFSGMYANTAEQLKKYQDQIDSTNNIQSSLEDYINSYKEGRISYDQALKGINGLLTQLNQDMSATDNLQNIFDYLGTVNSTEANADAVLKGIQSGLKDTATELLKSMEQYNKNAGMISEYTSSWQQLTVNVSSMLDVLKEVRDNLDDAVDRDDSDDDNDNTRYGGGKDGSPGVPGRGDYVNSGPGVFADGIENGLVGKSSDSERDKMLKHLATNNLKPGEVPILAHTGEAILNEDQKAMLMKNFANAVNLKPTLPDYTQTLQNVSVKQPEQTINISHGDLSFPNVRNIDDAITEFAQLSEAAIRQELGKR